MQNYKKILLILGMFAGLRMLIGATSTVYLVDIKGFSVNEVSLLRGFQFCLWFLLDIPISYFADKYSRRFSILVAILFSSIWLILTSLASAKWLIYTAEMFNSLGLIFASGASIAFLIDHYKKDKETKDVGKAITKMQKYSTISMIIAVFISAFFAMHYLNTLWMIAGVLTLIFFFFSFYLLPKETPRKEENKTHKSLKNDINTIFKITTNIKIVFAFIAFCFYFAYMNNVINYTQVVSYEGYPNLNEPYFHSIIFIIVLAMQTLASMTHKQKIPAILYSFIIFISFIAMIILPDKVNLIIFVMLYYIISRFYLSLSTSIHNIISDDLRATVDSVANTLGLITGSILALWIFVFYKDLTSLYIALGFVMALATLVLLIHHYINKKIVANKI